MDIVCTDCGMVLGEITGGVPDPLAYRCFDCHVETMHGESEWLHIETQPVDINRMYPVTCTVMKRGYFDDHADWADEEVTIDVLHEDMRDDALPMLMGNTVRKMAGGRVKFDNLYIRGTGCFRLRFKAPGHEPVYSFSFKVT